MATESRTRVKGRNRVGDARLSPTQAKTMPSYIRKDLRDFSLDQASRSVVHSGQKYRLAAVTPITAKTKPPLTWLP